MKNLTLREFLKFLADADGGDALEIISKFQSGGLCVEGLTADDVLES